MVLAGKATGRLQELFQHQAEFLTPQGTHQGTVVELGPVLPSIPPTPQMPACRLQQQAKPAPATAQSVFGDAQAEEQTCNMQK